MSEIVVDDLIEEEDTQKNKYLTFTLEDEFYGIEIKYVGLRPGEKLYEELLSDKETTLPSFHEKIRICKVREYDFNLVNQEIKELIDVAKTYDDMSIVRKMIEINPEYHPNNTTWSTLNNAEPDYKIQSTRAQVSVNFNR